MGKNSTASAVVLVLTGVLIAVFLMGGQFTIGPQPTEKPEVTVTGTCPDSGLTDVRAVGVLSVPTTTGEETKVSNQTVYMYLASDPQTPYDEIHLNGSGYVSTTNDVPCGSEVFFIYGDGMSYYKEKTETVTVDGAVYTVKLTFDKIGYLDITADTPTQLGLSSGMNLTMGPSETNTDVYLNLKQVDSQGVWKADPEGNILVAVAYNSAYFQEVSVIGGTSVACPSNITATDGRVTKCYLVNIGGDIRGIKTLDNAVNLKIVSKDIDPAGQTITITVADYGCEEKNGELYCGFEDLANNDGTDVGAPNPTFDINIVSS